MVVNLNEAVEEFRWTAMTTVIQYEYMHIYRYCDVSVTYFILADHFFKKSICNNLT